MSKRYVTGLFLAVSPLLALLIFLVAMEGVKGLLVLAGALIFTSLVAIGAPHGERQMITCQKCGGSDWWHGCPMCHGTGRVTLLRWILAKIGARK